MAKLRQVIFKAACFYSVASLVYVALVALMVKGNTTVADAYSLVLGNLAVLFGYSLVFGASFLLFDAAKLPQSARRLLHVIVLYAATIAAHNRRQADGADENAEVWTSTLPPQFSRLAQYIAETEEKEDVKKEPKTS